MILDIAIGILLSIGVSLFFHMELTWFFVSMGIIFALLPDVDFLWMALSKKKINGINYKHRKGLHYPLIFIPIGVILISLFNKEYSMLFSLAVLWHFIHDSAIISWGVQWFWPFSNKYFSFFRKSIGGEKPGLAFRVLYIWSPEEVEKMSNKYGDPEWIKNLYFKLNPVLIIEIVFLFFALAILLLKI
jgi:membrane-bound metal-dependent hydrolase YbcI (DUF457 family)